MLRRSRSLPSFRENGKHYCYYYESQGITKHSPTAIDTTLFEPVPFDGVDKDEKAYIEKRLEHRNLFPLENITGSNPGKRDIKGGPVLQVTCITICNDNFDLKDGYKIHGTISSTDYAGNNVFVYDRTEGDPETQLSSQLELSLTSSPLVPMRGNGLTFSLFNTRGDQIFSTNTYVDYKFGHDCEEDDELLVYGNYGFYAKMLYSIIPFAVIANVTMHLIGPPHPKTIKVEGEIIANGFSFLKENTFKLHQVKGKKESVFHVKQSRTVLALPLYSVLYLEFQLTRRGTDFALGALSAEPYVYGQSITTANHYCEWDEYYFYTKVEWVHPDEFFGILPQLYDPPGAVTCDYYVEVFSIVVGGGDSSLPALCGSIAVQDKEETVYIFSRNSRCPDNLLSNGFRGILSLAWPTNRWVIEKNFYMHLKLKDDKNRPICRGSLCWFDDCDLCPTRFDKRMCAVIPGNDDYFVALHYSIFKDGLRAKVAVIVECGDSYDQFDVYGSVCAQYSNHDYRSAYDKEYYQIINFNRSYEYRAKVRNCFEIPLSKSLVTAPSDCTGLQVFVHLTVRPYMTPDVAAADLKAIGNHLFKVDDKNSSGYVFMFRDQGYMPLGHVKVNVDWSV